MKMLIHYSAIDAPLKYILFYFRIGYKKFLGLDKTKKMNSTIRSISKFDIARSYPETSTSHI